MTSFEPYKQRKLGPDELVEAFADLGDQGWITPDGVGSDQEPYSTTWCEALSHGLGEKFKEGMWVIDWGCGYGRYYNWLEAVLEDFFYYGFEPRGKNNGDLLIKFCRKTFELAHEPCLFEFIDNDEVVVNALLTCDAVILGSIFTHISIEAAHKLVQKFTPLLDRDGVVVFSVIIGDEYTLGEPAYEVEGSYHLVTHTEKQIEELAEKNDCTLTKTGSFTTNHEQEHFIYRLQRDE